MENRVVLSIWKAYQYFHYAFCGVFLVPKKVELYLILYTLLRQGLTLSNFLQKRNKATRPMQLGLHQQ